MRKYKTVYMSASFDPLHFGHVKLMREAKEKTDRLIVGVIEEKTPFLSLENRLEILKSLSFVDEVIIEHENKKEDIIKKYKIDAILTGKNWRGKYPNVICDENFVAVDESVENVESKESQNISFEKFLKKHGQSYGVFDNFSQAKLAINEKNIGYNNDDTLQRVSKANADLTKQIREFEYPIFTWLNKILSQKEHVNIIDFGGGLGQHYFNFKKVAIHTNFTWNVVDVEKIVAYGQEFYKDEKALKFVQDIDLIKNVDVFISCGSMQYVENFNFAFSNLPKHILFERLPLQENHKTFVTIQNANSSLNPQYIFNKDEFLKPFLGGGYKLVEEWASRYDGCNIISHPQRNLRSFGGLYLVR